ncbi:MAG: peptidyl-prolyl cis-trans isomerase [Deltaproteobacteria bacterium]|nr:peptidyl-prolyl cis-trans isomerase [Deltaproteobacteria bacterium]
MRQLKSYLILLSGLLLFCLPGQAVAAFWGADYLVKINDQTFSDADYRHWWKEWREPKMAVPDSVDGFVDFMLLSQEASDMQLSDNPNYKKKLSVFLKVRALMQLKGEEIDAFKVIPPRDELWKAYLKKYTPILNLQMVAVQEEEQADVIAQFMAQGIAFDKLAEAAGLDKVAEQLESTGPMRYTRIPEPLRSAVLPLKQGETVGPIKYGHAYYFLKVVDRQDGSDKDFESLKQNLIRASLKRQEGQLTRQLLERLKGKYKVTVDQALIDSIGPEGLKDAAAKKIAITIGELKIPAGFVFASIEKTQKSRGHAMRQAEAFADSKHRIVNDILVQVLTEKAALDRHYEKVPPLKYVYDFYSKYRLIKEFEDTVIKPQVKVTDADIEAYYKKNLKQFSREGMIEYAQVSTNETELAKQISEKLKNGADFFAVMQPISPAGVPTQKEPLVHLRPEIQEAVKSLSSGQTATVVNGENTYFIKVIRGVEREVIPLAKVRDVIVKTLEKQSFNDIRNGYLKQLRERSVIKVNKADWKSLHAELLKENAS